jgi:hypothetical protein
MSIIDTIKSLINGSPDAQAATAKMIEILAAEAIKTGQPDALVAVAAQWENLLEGNSRALAPASVDPSVQIDYTTAATLKPLVIKIMQQAYLGGVVEITNGTLKKALNTYMLANGGWKDADLQDNDPKPGIQPLWWSTLSCALYELRQTGDVSNDAKAWRTYSLAPHHIPLLSGSQPAPSLAPSWEPVA